MRLTKVLAGAAVVIGAASIAHASVEISSAPTSGISCSAGVCTPTAKKAVLNATDLANMLAASDVKITTGSGAVTITVSASFSWTSASRLTLDASQNVAFRAPVSVAGPGAVTIVTNDGGSGGQLVFFETGKLDFWDLSSSLTINGDSYTLVNDIATLAKGIASAPTGTFALAKDYDAQSDGKYRSSPITTPIQGTIDGLGHTISDLTIVKRSCDVYGVGLFSYVEEGGTVRDLHLDNVAVTARKPDYAGGIAGENSGMIANVWVSGTVGTVSGKYEGHCRTGYAGGVAGSSSSSGMIVNAHSSANVTIDASQYVGGYAGGLAGGAYNVDLSSATGTVNGAGAVSAGGLLGGGSGVTRSFATGAVTAGAANAGAGGLVGGGGIISNSYATGSANGSCAGGFAGYDWDEGNNDNSYSTGSVSGGSSSGGFFGCASGSGTDDYWDTETSGTTAGCGSGNCVGVTGLSDAQLKSALPAGFDKTIWARNKNINNGYPYLIDNPPR
jgi:hypothetical protein